MSNLKELILGPVLRRDFKSYVTKVFQELNPGEDFIDGWYISLLCDQIQNMVNGETLRLIINLPPRYMKSIICSIALPTFLLGHKPSTKIMCISYGDELASKLANDCRSTMEAKWYKETFPKTVIKADKRSVMDFETTKHGGRFATTVQGAITGRGADIIIMDDLLKPLDALSDTVREKVNETYGNTILSRLNNKKTGGILLIMQRLHEHDLAGYLQEKDTSFKTIKLPLIAEEREVWKIKNHITGKISEIIREPGDLLHPEREGIDVVESYRNSMGDMAFSAQYQQNPAPIGKGMVRREWLRLYQREPSIMKRIIISWDTGSKIMDTSAYSACVVIGLGNDDHYYLLKVERDRLEFPDLFKKVEAMAQAYEHRYPGKVITLVEDAYTGTPLSQQLTKQRINVRAIKSLRSKEQRFNIVILKAEDGNLLFPDTCERWYKSFEDELLTFPRSRYKDQCDALSQAIQYLEDNSNMLLSGAGLVARADSYPLSGCLFSGGNSRDGYWVNPGAKQGDGSGNVKTLVARTNLHYDSRDKR